MGGGEVCETVKQSDFSLSPSLVSMKMYLLLPSSFHSLPGHNAPGVALISIPRKRSVISRQTIPVAPGLRAMFRFLARRSRTSTACTKSSLSPVICSCMATLTSKSGGVVQPRLPRRQFSCDTTSVTDEPVRPGKPDPAKNASTCSTPRGDHFARRSFPGKPSNSVATGCPPAGMCSGSRMRRGGCFPEK